MKGSREAVNQNLCKPGAPTHPSPAARVPLRSRPEWVLVPPESVLEPASGGPQFDYQRIPARNSIPCVLQSVAQWSFLAGLVTPCE